MNYSKHIAELIDKNVDMHIIKDFISVLHSQNLFEVSEPFLKEPNLLAFWLSKITEYRREPVSGVNKELFEFLIDVCGDDVLENSPKMREELLKKMVVDLKERGHALGMFDSPRFWEHVTAKDISSVEQRQNTEKNIFSFLVHNKHFSFASVMLEKKLAVWDSSSLREMKTVESLDFFFNTGGSLDIEVWYGHEAIPALDYFVKMNQSNVDFMERLDTHLQKQNPEKLEEAKIKQYFEILENPVRNYGVSTILTNLKSRKDYKTIENKLENSENALMYAASHNADVVNSVKSLAEKNTEFLFTHIDKNGFNLIDYIMSNPENYTAKGYSKEIKKTTIDAIKYCQRRLLAVDIDPYKATGLMWKGLRLKFKTKFDSNMDLKNTNELFNYHFVLPNINFVEAMIDKNLVDSHQLWNGTAEDWKLLNKALLIFRAENKERKEVINKTSKSGENFKRLSSNESMNSFLEVVAKFPIHNEIPSEIKENLFWIGVQENHAQSVKELLNGISDLHLDHEIVDFVKKNQDVYDEGIIQMVDRLVLNQNLKLQVKPVSEKRMPVPDKSNNHRF